MSDYKETAVVNVSKDCFYNVREDSGFKEHILKHISSELAERIMGILEWEKEIIVGQSDLRVSEFKPTNSVEYRRQINWSPLVRCKDCKWRGELGCAVSIVDESDIPKDDDFCSWGERKEDAEKIN